MLTDKFQNTTASEQVPIPRRNNLELNTDIELAIRDLIYKIEFMGADVKLTDAVMYLDKARNSLADFIDQQ
jgi:hypothetical protein